MNFRRKKGTGLSKWGQVFYSKPVPICVVGIRPIFSLSIFVFLAAVFLFLSCEQKVVPNLVFSEETLSHWDRATFPTVEACARYHWEKHAAYLGKTPEEYTKDAIQFFSANRPNARPLRLKDGEQGYVIRTGPGGPGGYFTSDGKIVSFWYSYARRRR